LQDPNEEGVPIRRPEVLKDTIRTGIVLSGSEVVARFGDASAEFIKGFTGTDKQTGQRFAKGLADIAQHKVSTDPLEASKNIKQQAGFSAEVASTSRDNAEAVIARSRVRTSRTDDLPQYGRNHNVVDRVRILDGHVIEGSQSQMKFVGDRNRLLKSIASEEGKFARYRGIKLELPSEQYEGAAQHCRDQARQLRINADRAQQEGKQEVASKLRNDASNYERLAHDVRDSGMTTEQAIFYRRHPEIATALDIARTSHRAGLEGAGYGAAIGGSISLLQNIWALAQHRKTLGQAANDSIADAALAAALGYGSAFAGSAIKSGMQQSGVGALRSLSATNAPAMVVNVCLSLGGSVKKFVNGEITESQFLVEVGEKGAGLLSGAMMGALGQVLIPVPFVGAAIGGMIGCTLSSMFYQSALDAASAVEISREHLARVRAIQGEARERVAQEQADLDSFLAREIPALQGMTRDLFDALNATGDGHADTLAATINQYALSLGKQLQFQTLSEFEDFMQSDQPLRF
jgi:hypothetical protein